MGSLYPFPKGTMAIGRLDQNSEGLLLITTSSALSTFITSTKVEKEYYVQVDGNISSKAIAEMENGIEIGLDGKKYKTKPCRIKKIEAPNFPVRSKKIRDERHGPTSWISMMLTEGKFKQVRKMTAAAGCPTLRLIRVRIGGITLGDLESGEVRILNKFDLRGLY